MGKTSSAVKNRYNEKAYDRIVVTVPKGQRTIITAHAKSKQQSVNGLIKALLLEDMGISSDSWTKKSR